MPDFRGQRFPRSIESTDTSDVLASDRGGANKFTLLDPKSLPRDAETLQKIVVDLAAQLDRFLAAQNKYQSLLRELLEAQRNRKSEQLSKDQLALFEAAWQARSAEEETAATRTPDSGGTGAEIQRNAQSETGRPPASGAASDAGENRSRLGRGVEALCRLRQGPAAHGGGDQRTL